MRGSRRQSACDPLENGRAFVVGPCHRLSGCFSSAGKVPRSAAESLHMSTCLLYSTRTPCTQMVTPEGSGCSQEGWSAADMGRTIL
jgi:hypothetical protein